MSTEPQSRVPLDGPSSSLLTQFDINLRVVSDRYLGFFLERFANHNLRYILPLILFRSQPEDRGGLVSCRPRDRSHHELADSLLP